MAILGTLIFQNQILATLGYPQPAVVTPYTRSVSPNFLSLATAISIGMGAYGTQYLYSNGTTANTLLNNIQTEKNRIASYQNAIAAGEARQGRSYYRRTAQYSSYTNAIAACNARIDNYTRQLQRLVVYINPGSPYYPGNPYYGSPYYGYPYSPYRGPYYDQWGRSMYDAYGRPYFDQWGRPYSWTPSYYYNGSYGGNMYNWNTGTYYWG